MHDTRPGVVAAVVTPLNDDETIDVESLERLVEWVLRGGVRGFFVGGTMGEGLALLDRERERLVRETVRLVRGRALVLAGVSDTGSNRIKESIDHIADAGADAVVTTARVMFPARDRDDTLRLVEAVAAHSPLPVWFYENPGTTPVASTFEEIESIMALPNVRGLKFTSPDRDLYSRCAERFGDEYPVYNGNARDIAFAASLNTGALIGIAGMLPGLCARIWNAARAGRMGEAARLQRHADDIYDIYLGDHWPLWPSAQKHALKRLGVFSTSVSTAPFAQLDPEQEKRIDEVLDRMDPSIYEPASPGHVADAKQADRGLSG